MVEVSVIMPVYNAEDYLEESINTILSQTLTDLEVICVDDGSADNSLNILKEISQRDSRVKYFHQENRGGGAARNFAIPKATGKYIYFMDADDKIELNALEVCHGIAEEKNLDFLIFKARDYAEDTGEYFTTDDYTMEELSSFVGDKIFNYKDIGDLIFKISVTPWCKFYNRKFVVDSNAKFAEGLIFHDNIFFYDSLFYAERICFLDKTLYTRRRHSASSTGAGDERYLNYIKISDMIWDIFKRHGVFWTFIDEMFTKKVGVMHYWYKHIREEHKEAYFSEMKRNYEKVAQNEKVMSYVENDLIEWQKNIFKSALEAETREEFDLSIENYNLEVENRHLRELLNEPIYKLAFSKFR